MYGGQATPDHLYVRLKSHLACVAGVPHQQDSAEGLGDGDAAGSYERLAGGGSPLGHAGHAHAPRCAALCLPGLPAAGQPALIMLEALHILHSL